MFAPQALFTLHGKTPFGICGPEPPCNFLQKRRRIIRHRHRGTLTKGMWKLTASAAVIEAPAPIGTQNVGVYNTVQPCQQDNLYRYNEDGTTTTDEGATKCHASDPQQTTSGNWTQSADQRQITMNASGQTIAADIVTLNSATMTFRYVANYGGMKTTTTTTYAHQWLKR